MAKMVTLTIDDQTVTVPAGTLVVDAAKKVGNDIPVFCYHPKMEPVGMCRMCLVEIGRPMMDRASGQPVLEPDGKPRIQFAPKLETACTTPVSEGMVVRTENQKVTTARKEVLEFLLTSHPLDCPICDKGGECPLQNLTLAHGPGESRFLFDEKMRQQKHVPLGELIFLDRERCIQCARCVRFQSDIAADPVLGFSQRGRSLEIMTHSEPGFDSIFSGNTTDICPVGALTTADFRFGARPWEMKSAASLCNHCPVGCNLTYNVRREARSDGKSVIKRALPRQNEAVNEIWICDKARFVYHYTESSERLSQPLVRKNGELTPVSWDEALEAAAQGLRSAGEKLVVLAGGRLSNEDLFNLHALAAARKGRAVLYSDMAGGDLTAQLGLPPGSNLADLGAGSVVLVAASDLHEEAPLWWLRIKQAAQRGARLITLGARPTRLEAFASLRLRADYGQQAQALASLLEPAGLEGDFREAAEALRSAENVVIFFGSDGVELAESEALARAAADLLVHTGHTARPNNGLVGVWPHGNTQGAWDMGFHPQAPAELAHSLAEAGAVLLAAADPAGDNPALAAALDQAGFVVVQELFLTESARRADVVLPAAVYTEREGTYTSGERRVQRFFPVTPPHSGARPDFVIAAQLGTGLLTDVEGRAAALVMQRIAAQIPAYAAISYQRLAETQEQWPIIGRKDLYYGGTSYENTQGLGVSLPLPEMVNLPAPKAYVPAPVPAGALRLVRFSRLYDHGSLVRHSPLIGQRLAARALWLHPSLLAQLGVQPGEEVEITAGDEILRLPAAADENLPLDAAGLPRSAGFPTPTVPWVVVRVPAPVPSGQANKE